MLFHAFPFYPCYPCFSGALIFRKNKKGFDWVIFTWVTKIISCAPRDVFLQKELHINQIFHLLNKKVQKKFPEIFLPTELITLKSFIRKNGLINIVPKHSFNVTLADFEQIIMISYNWKLNNWMILIIFPGRQTNQE